MKNTLIIYALLILFSNRAYSEGQAIRMLFVGDMMLDELPGEVIKRGENPFSAFDELFEKADIKIGNLELSLIHI